MRTIRVPPEIAGVAITGSLDGVAASFNAVQGNFIGTTRTGTAALGNGADGVQVFGDHNTIGGTATVAWATTAGGNGHYYALTSWATTWDQAEAQAVTSGGHLVIRSSCSRSASVSAAASHFS